MKRLPAILLVLILTAGLIAGRSGLSRRGEASAAAESPAEEPDAFLDEGYTRLCHDPGDGEDYSLCLTTAKG